MQKDIEFLQGLFYSINTVNRQEFVINLLKSSSQSQQVFLILGKQEISLKSQSGKSIKIRVKKKIYFLSSLIFYKQISSKTFIYRTSRPKPLSDKVKVNHQNQSSIIIIVSIFRLLIQTEKKNPRIQIMNNRVSKQSQNKISTDQESYDDHDCECQILCDTSLSNVSDQSCDCSQCLEANLNAYNELKELQEQEQLKHARSLDKFQTRIKPSKNESQTNQQLRSTTRQGRTVNMSLNKNQLQKSYLTNGDQQINLGKSTSKNVFTQQNLNDYIMITRQRTRQYLNQRNKIDRQNKKEQDQLKRKIKENLEILKYTVEALKDKEPQKEKQNQQEILHQYKWNHAPAISKKLKEIRKKKTQCKHKIQQRKRNRAKVETNLEKLIPQFSHNPSEFLQQAKQKRLEKLKPCKGCPHDHCPNHHMRTSKEKLQEIENFIMNKVKEYNDRKKKQKQKQEENQKVKKAKLRAIDIKCKEILKKSKKYDISESRTSFRLSIDHFSTFSDLKAHKKQQDEQRQHKKQVKKMMKQKGGRLQEAIYEDAFEHEHPQEQKPKPVPKIQVQSIMKKEYCQKITKDAKIHSPRNIKADDEKYKKQKQLKRKVPMNAKEEKKKASEITLEIQRKKHQLMQEYKRQQQLKKSRNEKLKNEHKESLIQSRQY